MRTDRTRKGRDIGNKKESFRDRILRRAKERRSGNRNLNIPEGMEYYRAKKMPRGESARLDIIPYRVTEKDLGYASPGDLWYERTYFLHRNVGGGNSSCICPSTVGKKCPICEYAADLSRQPKTKDNEEILKNLRPKQRQIFNVIDLNDPDKGVQIHENAFHNFGKELEKELNETNGQNPEFGEFADLKTGFTLKIRWDEEQQAGFKPFFKAGRIDFIERKRPYSKDILDDAIDLDKALIILSYEEIERIFHGAEDQEEDSSDESERSHSSKHHTREDDDEDADRHAFDADQEAFDADQEAYDERDRKRKKNRDDEDEEEEERSHRKRRHEEDDEEESRSKRKKKNECPLDDGVFGKDHDEYEECEECEVWGECKQDYKENHRKSRRQ